MEKKQKGLYVADVRKTYKGKEYCTHLIRRSYREGGKVCQETIANISDLPQEAVEIIRYILKGEVFVPVDQAMETIRSRSHGHVVAVRKMLHESGLLKMIAKTPTPRRNIIEALIIARILKPQTKLATNRWWHTTTLPEIMGVEDVDVDDIYDAMDWLVGQQKKIEHALATRHLENGSLVLYDVSSSYYEGSCCSLAEYGYNRDKKKGKRQIVYGLMADSAGRPVSVKVYPGATSDIDTLQDQIDTLKKSFGLDEVVLAVDRGMISNVKIETLKELGGIDWVTALRANSIKSLVKKGHIQPSMFDQKDLMEIYSEDYPGERLVVCRNPYLALERTRKRQELLLATERELEKIVKRVAAGRLVAESKIGEALGRVVNKFKMAKHFEFDIGKGRFSYRRCEESIALEEALDGFYVLRTSVPEEKWPKEDVVRGYKSLSRVEKGFRTLKGVNLRIRPIHHRLEERVEAHIFLCTLAYYVEWHLRETWKELLFDDEHPGEHENGSPVLPACRSEGALHKASTRQNGKNPLHSFATLLEELGTIQCNENWIPAIPKIPSFYQFTKPNEIQKEALGCLRIDGDKLLGRQKNNLKSL